MAAWNLNVVMMTLCLFVAATAAGYWPGRVCCELPFSTQCQNACNRARSSSDLRPRCHKNHEEAFYNCVDRQEVSASCCNSAASSQCRAACKAVFIDESFPSRSQREAVAEVCDNHVTSCVLNYTQRAPRNNPRDSMPCCGKSDNGTCQQECGRILHTHTEDNVIMDELIGVCGNVNLQEPLWRCFLMKSGGRSSQATGHQRSRSTLEQVGMDATKLLCCNRAHTSTCSNLCIKTYSRGWTNSWNRFNAECIENPSESALNACLYDVEEPCQVGCDGLQYCSAFNSRPTEMFRSCNPHSSTTAQQMVLDWRTKRAIELPKGGSIPLQDIAVCQPEAWKAVACMLSIKPCNRRTHTTAICRMDCIALLSECVDWSQLPPHSTAEALCDIIAPQDENINDCTSVHTYLSHSRYHGLDYSVTQPCQPNPCAENEICHVDRKCHNAALCVAYICKPACKLGEVSTFSVTHGDRVRIINTPTRGGCYKSCSCNREGLLSDCTDLGCVRDDSCLLTSGRIHAHGSSFQMDCRECTCHSREIICQQRACLDGASPVNDNRHLTGLPCNCPPVYMSVCGINGQTFPSACIARCSGLRDSQFDFGACSAKDPCQTHSCPRNHHCVPHRHVCLGSFSTRCQQYYCVDESVDCLEQAMSPVCDTRGFKHDNICSLFRQGRQIDYHGQCKSGCRHSGVVCGYDGETYSSECAAWAAHVPVDYWGHCRSIPSWRGGGRFRCDDVDCPEPSPRGCATLLPPGGCCPICAGEVRVLYSKRQTDLLISKDRISEISVGRIAEKLSEQLSVLECDIFSYLSIENDLVFLVMPHRPQPTQIQMKACQAEALRLGGLLRSSNPTVTAHLELSPLVMAYVQIPKSSASPASSSHLQLLLLSLSWSIIFTVWRIIQR